uniref:UDENN domain-containing protein n=1 Tax=Strongyloides stercoralis TaxID=6248 RepID=A0A0K0EH32_STRER
MGKENEKKPWERFHKWIHSICVVTFDLEIGQRIEFIYPGDTYLSKEESTSICYMSMPDSHSPVSQETSYHFRLHKTFDKETHTHQLFIKNCPQALSTNLQFLYGYVVFRQQKDINIKRGYYQKSVVILAPYPLHIFYYKIVKIIANAFFEFGELAIESACKQLDDWPAPEPGAILKLGLLNNTIHCRIPKSNDVEQRYNLLSPIIENGEMSEIKLHTMHEFNLYKYLRSIASNLNALWEIVLTGDPLIVMAPSPAICAPLTEALVSLIHPLQYSGDYRPYFTIHDPDFSLFTNSSQIPCIILGVTNPYFNKTMQHFPHLLRLGDINVENKIESKKKKINIKLKTHDTKLGFFSSSKFFLNDDNSLIKKLTKTGSRPDDAQHVIIRKHFTELTECFMFPFERYLLSLMPLRKDISLFNPIPKINNFNVDDFLQSLIQHKNPLKAYGVQKDISQLYRRFIKTQTFKNWFTKRCEDINFQLVEAYHDIMKNINISTLNLSKHNHVEVVDLVMKISNRFRSLSSTMKEEKSQLRKQLTDIMADIDDELKSVLLSNNAFRELFDFYESDV